MKTRHFNRFRIRTYRKSARNSFVLRTYKKGGGWGAPEREAPGKARSLRPGHFYGRRLRDKQVLQPDRTACCAIILSFCGAFV